MLEGGTFLPIRDWEIEVTTSKDTELFLRQFFCLHLRWLSKWKVSFLQTAFFLRKNSQTFYDRIFTESGADWKCSLITQEPDSWTWLPRSLCSVSAHLSSSSFTFGSALQYQPSATPQKDMFSPLSGWCSNFHLCLEYLLLFFFSYVFFRKLNHYCIWKTFLNSLCVSLIIHCTVTLFVMTSVTQRKAPEEQRSFPVAENVSGI